MSLYNDASLVMIPSAYKDGKLYSIKPTDGSGDFTFSRGSNLAATRVDENGLIEKGRENLLLQSNTFSSWSIDDATLTSGQSGYDGLNDAWLLKQNTNASRHNIFRSVVPLYTGIGTFSIYAKAKELQYIQIAFAQTTDQYANFDLSDGSVGNVGSDFFDAKATSIGDGWYRLSVVNTRQSNSIYISIVTSKTAVWLETFSGANATDGLYIQDAQLEAGLVATDYIETTTTTAQAGILEDMPRLNYSGGASCPSLLLEPTRTNQVLNSEYRQGSDATDIRISSTSNASISPEGVQNATLFTENTDNSTHLHSLGNVSWVAGTTYTISVYAKSNGRNVQLAAGNPSIIEFTTAYDLTNGVVLFSSASSSSIEDAGNGWYRLTATATAATSSSTNINAFLYNDAISYLGDNTSGVYVYGYQKEEGSYPTSYIPCYGAATSRSEDSCTKTGISSLIGQEQGTLFVDFVFNGNPTNIDYNFIILGSLGSNYINVGAYNKSLYARVKNTSLQVAINALMMVEGTRYKVALGYAENDVVMYVNGVNEGADTSVSIPAVSQIGLTRPSFAQSADVNQTALFKTRLTNGELAALTTI